jgi:hypothetical protein
MMLAHTIEVASGDKITRVHCNTCKSQHAFRPKPPGRTTSERKAGGSSRISKEMTPREEYESLMRGKNPAAARRYVLADRFKAGEVIKHPQFGIGVVKNLKDGDKIQVAFADAPRILVHGHRV